VAWKQRRRRRYTDEELEELDRAWRRWRLEERCRDRAFGYFGLIVKRMRLLKRQRVYDQLENAVDEGVISREELVDAIDAAVYAWGRSRDTNRPVVILAEATPEIGCDDVQRACRRAEIVGRVLQLPCLPVVVGETIDPDAEALARDRMWRVIDERTYAPGEPAPTGGEKASL